MDKKPDSSFKCKPWVTQFLIWKTYISLRHKEVCCLKQTFLMVHDKPSVHLTKQLLFGGV